MKLAPTNVDLAALRRLWQGEDAHLDDASMQRIVDAAASVGRIGATGDNPDTLPFVEKLSGPTQYRDLIRLLRAKGRPQRIIEKIMGLNVLAFAQGIRG